MSDAYGDDYSVEIEASSEEEAMKIATLIDDDANPYKCSLIAT